jgi:diguanylate cyclase (GGDEF)-like protein
MAPPADPDPSTTIQIEPTVPVEPEASLQLPGTRPRVSLPVLLPSIAAVAVLLSHVGLIVFLREQGMMSPVAMSVLGWSTTIVTVITIATMTGFGIWLGRRIDRILAVLERTQVGDYSERVPVGLHDDIGMLARRVNLLVATSAAREKRILESALLDALTGLPNRTLLTERIRHSLAISARTRGRFAVAVIDLDRFKIINDSLGHSTGDAVLREVARRLRTTVRDSDTVARIGGDEFVLLLHGGRESVREVARRILEAMKPPLEHRGQSIEIGMSIGIAMHPDHGANDRTLLLHADTAMYRAKRRRGGFEIYDPDSVQEPQQRSYMEILAELRTALDAGQIALDWQPRLDLSSGLICGIEGLLRWNHPTRGKLHPADFLPAAERTGYMRELTRWVVQQGTRFSAALGERGLDLVVSLNVAAMDIESKEFAGTIAQILREGRMRPERLSLEITEKGLASNSEQSCRNLEELSRLGVRVSLDDFGTGLSTIEQMQKLHLKEVKIDRSFVTGMNQNRANQQIVRSMIDLGKQLGVRVVGEGVESVTEMRELASMGCNEIQGYYIAKPMNADEAIAWVEMRHALYTSSREQYFKSLLQG